MSREQLVHNDFQIYYFQFWFINTVHATTHHNNNPLFLIMYLEMITDLKDCRKTLLNVKCVTIPNTKVAWSVWARLNYAPKLWRANLNMSLVQTHLLSTFFSKKTCWKPITWSWSACKKNQTSMFSLLIFNCWVLINANPSWRLTFSWPMTILITQLSGVGWWSWAVMLCWMLWKGRLCKQAHDLNRSWPQKSIYDSWMALQRTTYI